jgi:hypothetical protein
MEIASAIKLLRKDKNIKKEKHGLSIVKQMEQG